MPELDDTDRKILDILKDNARASVSEIARKVHKSRTAVEARIAKMEQHGPIKGYRTLIDEGAKATNGTSLMLLKNSELNVCNDIWTRIKDKPGIVDVFSLFGEHLDMVVILEHSQITQVIDFKEDLLQTGLVEDIRIMPVLTHWNRK